MNSCLYFGEVCHERLVPKKHFFRYRLFMTHLFLDELEEVFSNRLFWSINRPNLASFQRKDYHGEEGKSLEESVRETMAKQLGEELQGRISILTHLRYFGHCFNPVTFYYCWDQDLKEPIALMTEITNTPWNETHPQSFIWNRGKMGDACSTHNFRKEFHVSPFIGMDVDYEWKFTAPGENLHVEMINRENDKVSFSAKLELHKKPISTRNLSWALLRFPFITLQVFIGIYWQALLLRIKGCPHHPHPAKDSSSRMALND